MGKFETDRFNHMIEVMKRLDHPNIVKLYELYDDEKRYYLSMQLCNGGELFDKLQQEEKLNEEKASIIAHQVIGAISYCHR